MYKALYSRFLSSQKEYFHMASHSHHYWPDVTREAQLQYWDDSARWVDNKWEHIFGKVLPRLQDQLAKVIGSTAPRQITFAPNTHELVYRVLSCLSGSVKVLTTDSEFYSFERQISRIEETRGATWEVTRIPQLPLDTFEDRFAEAIKSQEWNLIFVSQVFFNSGFAPAWEKLVEASSSKSIFILDAYHGFMALPTSIKKYQDRIFYIAGAYKYAQAGEGCCFMHVPTATEWTPEYTGWFAEFGDLSNKQKGVPFANDGYRFAGSTMDFSAAYRLLAVLDLFSAQGIQTEQIHQHIQRCQKAFLDHLWSFQHSLFNKQNLMFLNWEKQGHFLTFELPSSTITDHQVQQLKAKGIWVDSRKNRLRFGFGMYHNPEDYLQLDFKE